MKRLLMVSEKFPPFNVSGSARPLYFAKYLPEFGYEPMVLASSVAAGEERDDALLGELAAPVPVWRTPRLYSPWVARRRARSGRGGGAASAGAANADADAAGAEREASGERAGARQALLSYLSWWAYWELDWALLATLAGWAHGRHALPDVIWVSAPPFRNCAVAYRLARWLNRPLVVDLRDPWTYGSLWRPKTERIASAERAWARRVLALAARVIFTSPLTLSAMHERFPELRRERWLTITNGFDDVSVSPLRGVPDDVCLFRYVGVLNERRRPDVLISAFARAAEDPEFRATAALELIGNAGGHEHKVSLAPGCNVRFLGHVSRAESLRYAFGSDVNVLLQTISEGQDVVSGKAFDYLHARKPMLAVVDEAGGDAWFVRETGVGRIAPWSNVEGVGEAMRQCWLDFRAGRRGIAPGAAEKFSRRGLAGQLARVLDDVLDGSTGLASP
ncbi:MAG TPA: glycosyltransferase [Polyangiaceae bacterium]|nr:glycosyltransferase [Polyangiaceae bacterium]